MNATTRRTCLMFATMLCAAESRAQERVDLMQVPAPVRDAVSATRDQGPVKVITRRTQDGRTVYEVEFERRGAPNPRLRFAEDGTLLREATATGDGWLDAEGLWTSSSTLKVENLPAAVQATARREADGREIADIDEERWDGKIVYEIEFRQRGRNPHVHIAEDGKVVRDEPARSSLKARILGTQLDDTPPAVQETIRRVAGDREIIDIDKRGTKERPVYRVVARRNGISYEILHVGMDGKVLFNNWNGTPPDRG